MSCLVHYHLVSSETGRGTYYGSARQTTASPVCISGFADNAAYFPMKMKLGKKEMDLLRESATHTTTLVTEKGVTNSFHVNLYLPSAETTGHWISPV